ncbi:MAG: site-2 protease family protein [Cyclonatronaceae bacterium]
MNSLHSVLMQLGLKRLGQRNIRFERWRLTVDPLLPVVLLLLAWALSVRYYPEVMHLDSAAEYWLMGGLTAVFISVSIIVHELGHSFTARALHIPIERIHLYLFGGMAELQHRPHQARQEFWIALAGPLASFVLAGFSWVMYELLLTPVHQPYYFFRFLALINFMIGLFNLLPIFPLDGGRLLRSFLWGVKGNYITASKATRQAGTLLVGGLLLLAMADYVLLDSGYAMIGGILAMYMFYTHYTGRVELNYAPEPDELVHLVQHEGDTRAMISSIAGSSGRVMQRCIFPVLEQADGEKKQVIEGRHIQQESYYLDPSSIRNAREGDYIEMETPETYGNAVKFNAEWIPVFRGNTFIGMCDAREMRFWLEQHGPTAKIRSSQKA